MVERAGAVAGFEFKAHPHMLRHACGFVLANKGHDTRSLQAYLGHKNIQHTVRAVAGTVQGLLAVSRPGRPCNREWTFLAVIGGLIMLR
jgi:integrase